MRSSIDPRRERRALARLAKHGLGIVDCSTSHYREDGTQRWEVVDRTGDRVRPESHQVSEPARLECATSMALAVELRTSNGVQLHSRILVDGIPRPLDTGFQRAPGHHAPERK